MVLPIRIQHNELRVLLCVEGFRTCADTRTGLPLSHEHFHFYRMHDELQDNYEYLPRLDYHVYIASEVLSSCRS